MEMYYSTKKQRKALYGFLTFLALLLTGHNLTAQKIGRAHV